mmetsp:Transcript_50491/g.118848  ORF Transcript_50491/g.118848 Transcript_50491/m.118848 type:complete len:243 (-) Transcript_50491:184-912(-)
MTGSGGASASCGMTRTGRAAIWALGWRARTESISSCALAPGGPLGGSPRWRGEAGGPEAKLGMSEAERRVWSSERWCMRATLDCCSEDTASCMESCSLRRWWLGPCAMDKLFSSCDTRSFRSRFSSFTWCSSSLTATSFPRIVSADPCTSRWSAIIDENSSWIFALRESCSSILKEFSSSTSFSRSECFASMSRRSSSSASACRTSLRCRSDLSLSISIRPFFTSSCSSLSCAARLRAFSLA